MGGIVRKTVESYIRGKGSRGVWTLLGPLSYLYEVGVRARLGLYRAGALSSRTLPCAVVSVGNITAGGSGKTPLTMYIARYLKKKGVAVAVVSRGYGGSLKGPAVVSTGEEGGILLGAAEAGDEPLLMARRLQGVPVVIGADRFAAGELAIKEFSSEVIILDDGFQHIRLSRDLNILLVDGSVPLVGAALLPAGPLREPVSACRRADMVLVKGVSLHNRDKEMLRAIAVMSTGFVYKTKGVRELCGGKSIDMAALKGTPLLAVAGIARPESFFNTLRGLGLNIAGTISYSDHYPYKAEDLRVIRDKMKTCCSEVLITTEKDGVKLSPLLQGGGVEGYALSIDVELKEKSLLRRALAPLIAKAGAGRVVEEEKGARP